MVGIRKLSRGLTYVLALIILFSAAPSAEASLVVKTVSTPSNLTNGLVGHWTFDGPDMKNNVADRSGHGNHGYMTGFTSTSTATVPGRMGQGLKFNGTSNYIRVNTSSALNLTGDITVNGWINITNVVGGAPIFEYGSGGFLLSGTDRGYGLFVRNLSGSLIAYWNLSGATSNTATFGYTVSPINDGKWYMITTVTSGSNHYMYSNGVLVHSTVVDTGDRSVSASGYIGRDDNGGDFLSGKIDDVRIYSRALSASEIKQLYSMGADTHQNVTAKDDLTSGLVGHWTFDGPDMKNNVRDRSGNNNNGYMVGFTSTSNAVVAGKVGQGLKFDGVNDYVNAGNNASISGIGAGNFTLSSWIKTSTKDRDILGNNTSAVGKYLFQIDAGGHAKTTLWTTGGSGTAVSPSVISNDKWHHVVSVINGNTIAIWVDGVQADTKGITGTKGSDNTPVVIGARGNSFSYKWAGSLDDVRIYNRALSESEVKQLYNMGR